MELTAKYLPQTRKDTSVSGLNQPGKCGSKDICKIDRGYSSNIDLGAMGIFLFKLMDCWRFLEEENSLSCFSKGIIYRFYNIDLHYAACKRDFTENELCLNCMRGRYGQFKIPPQVLNAYDFVANIDIFSIAVRRQGIIGNMCYYKRLKFKEK